MLDQITVFGLISFLNFILTLSLSLVAFFTGRKNTLKLSYSFFAFTLSFYAFFYSLWQFSSQEDWAIAFFKWTIVGVVLINTALFHFTYALLKWLEKKKNHVIAVHFINVFFCYAAIELFYLDWKEKFSYGIWPIPSQIFHIYLIWWFFQVLFCLSLIWKEGIVKSVGKQKQQCEWVLAASCIGYFGGATNWFVWYGFDVPPYLNAGVAVYAIILGYAILRHSLLDIEVIIRKTLILAGIVVAAVSAIALPLAILQSVIGEALGAPHPMVLMAIGIATTALIYRPVEKNLINITDKYLFQKGINYRLLLREASEYLAHVDSLKQQTRNIVAFLLKKARITNAAVFAFGAPDKAFLVVKASRPIIREDDLKRISISHPLIQLFYKRQEPIEINLLKEVCEAKNVSSSDYEGIQQLMKTLKAEAAIPCYGGEASSKFDKKTVLLKGVLFLGHQKSDKTYSEEELDVFFTLGQESSIAFENARLYDEAIDRSLALEKANKELNKINQDLKELQAAFMEEKKRALLAGIGKSIAHEINNPLTPLAMNLYFVKTILEELESLHKKCLTEPTEKNIGLFSESVKTASQKLLEVEKGKDRIKGIVQTLRDLVRERTGEKKGVQLRIIVDSAIEEMKYQTYWETLSAPSIEVQMSMSLPFVAGITHDLQGVFVNLMINALHAMENRDSGRKITIAAALDKDKPDYVKITFSDNGCGIPKELHEKIFEHGFTTKGKRGTGIGLFYCKDNIERVHGGKITVESEPGVGTCFTMWLPCHKDTKAE